MADDHRGNDEVAQEELEGKSSALEIERSSWRRVSAVLASTVTLLAALGPLTAWVNGCQDRKLQEARTRDEISLRYMDLLLTRSESLEERRAVLDFLEKALSAENPETLMLDTVQNEQARIRAADKLKDQLPTLKAKIVDLEDQKRASAQREAEYERKIASLQSASGSDEENARLKAELRAAKETSRTLQEELTNARQRVAETQRQLRTEQATIGARVTTPPRTFEQRLDLRFSEIPLPEDDKQILRRAAMSCHNFGGDYSLVSSGPSKHYLACSIGETILFLDKSSFQVPYGANRVPAPIGSPSRGGQMCSSAGASLVAEVNFGRGPYLCRREDGTGIVVEDWAGW